jgi:hypothetical protein
MSGKLQLSQSEKWAIKGFSSAGAIGLILAGIVASRQIIAAIWIIALSLLTYVIVFWISSRGRIRRRTPFATVMGLIVFAACGSWHYAESHNRGSAKGQLPPPSSVDIQQNTSGAGSAAVVGNGNSVKTNAASPAEQVKKGEKK